MFDLPERVRVAVVWQGSQWVMVQSDAANAQEYVRSDVAENEQEKAYKQGRKDGYDEGFDEGVRDCESEAKP